MTLKQILKDLRKIKNNKVGINRDDYAIQVIHGSLFFMDHSQSAYVNDIEIDDKYKEINLLCE